MFLSLGYKCRLLLNPLMHVNAFLITSHTYPHNLCVVFRNFRNQEARTLFLPKSTCKRSYLFFLQSSVCHELFISLVSVSRQLDISFVVGHKFTITQEVIPPSGAVEAVPVTGFAGCLGCREEEGRKDQS